MDKGSNIQRAAEHLVREHGLHARRVARERAHRWTIAGSETAASFWEAIARAIPPDTPEPNPRETSTELAGLWRRNSSTRT
jgi:hypothetical protein